MEWVIVVVLLFASLLKWLNGPPALKQKASPQAILILERRLSIMLLRYRLFCTLGVLSTKLVTNGFGNEERVSFYKLSTMCR
jgi:hypothetical protein